MTAPCVWRLVAADVPRPVVVDCGWGELVAYSRRAPGRVGANQDGCLAISLGAEEGAILAVADGAGGLPGAERSASVVLDAFVSAFETTVGALRERILVGIEGADRALAALKLGAGSTMALVHVRRDGLRSFHVGDSAVMMVGQRGRRHFTSIAHSPVGYAVEAGVLDENEALVHEDRHIVSNLLGAGDARIEMSARLPFSARDTVLLGSDGLFDNLPLDAIVGRIRKGSLERAAIALATASRACMRAGSRAEASAAAPPRVGKPDDLTFLLWRPPSV